jgi:DNA-binding MarR family transcriptional regulator
MSRPSAPPPDPAARLAEALPGFGRLFSRYAQSLAEGATPARMRLLGVLHCKGPQIMCDLGEDLGVTARQVTNLVDAMEAEGVVRRAAHPTDRRATVIEITCQGMAQAEQFYGPYHEKLLAVYRELPEADQRELLRLLQTLTDAVQRRLAGGGKVPGGPACPGT